MPLIPYQNIQQVTDLMMTVNRMPLLIDYQQLETLSVLGKHTRAESSYSIGGLPDA